MSLPDSIKRDLEFCNEHRELADLLIEHGCAPAGEDRDLLRALVEFMDRSTASAGEIVAELWRNWLRQDSVWVKARDGK